MTDLLIAAILIIMLIQWHNKEKHMGWYGKLYVMISKRFRRFIKIRIGITKKKKTIKEAINKHNFNTIKQKFISNNDIPNVLFLRKGISGDYKNELTQEQINKLNDRFGETLEKLGYDI